MKWKRNTGFVLLLAVSNSVSAADKAPLFQDKEVIKAVLTAPIAQAYDQREQEVRIYMPGQWTYVDGEGETQRLDVSIRARGNFRRTFCTRPPLQLNFKKSQVKGTLFQKQDKLKLVAPCEYGPASQQYVLKEYLAYRIFEVLTDHSFGTRLIRLSYIDSDNKLPTRTALVFVIEDDDAVAERLGLDKLKVGHNEIEDLDESTTALVDLFQLLIGNNDYSVLKGPEGAYCCHNIEMFVNEESANKRIPVPFDFDMSGIVNTDYSAPPSYLPIKTVRTRYYRGLCQQPEVLDATLAHIRSKREEIMALIGETGELSRLSTNRGTKFLGDFFELLDDSEAVKTKIVDRCRGEDRSLEAAASD